MASNLSKLFSTEINATDVTMCMRGAATLTIMTLSITTLNVMTSIAYAVRLTAGNTKGGSITVPFTSCLTGLD